ncbi:NUDIX domain-containing protein [Microvirga sp. SYSU G3D207]|uniref:NUDIX domain-containing protein n=1 Tax=Microvirga arsenatis TaxID=2692265 RepID=A0ABW9YWD3_9HYPH|nr:NUDIX domain-containing protein [Microvirga arsenatis]NBJ10402.1 NUDIX domain-containing protein [Microvirga arsenatis]NBJ24699.1 NUDIX domain-containing protein [Microvirga arsenatis]
MDQGGRAVIEIVTALVRNEHGQVLLVRKRGTRSFMQPGGKREPGESDLASLAREIREELGCGLAEASTRSLGTFEAPAANEPGQWVRATVYAAELSGEIGCRAEIAEAAWVDPGRPGNRPLAPLTRDIILPLALALNGAQAL